MNQKTLDFLGMTQEQWDERVKQEMRNTERDNLYKMFCMFRDYAKKARERYLEMQIGQDGSGSINISGQPGCNEWLAWNDLDEGPEKLAEAIKKWEKEDEENN